MAPSFGASRGVASTNGVAGHVGSTGALPPSDVSTPAGQTDAPSESDITRQQEDVLGTDQEQPEGVDAGSSALPKELKNLPSGTSIPGDPTDGGTSFPSQDDSEVNPDDGTSVKEAAPASAPVTTQGPNDINPSSGTDDSSQSAAPSGSTSTGDVDSSSGTSSDSSGKDDSGGGNGGGEGE
jgi:hypothetical protein